MIMKRLLTAIITVNLAFFPSVKALADCSYDDDATLAAAKSACTGASVEWNCELNRCMTKEEVTQLRADYKACEGLTGDEQKSCVNSVAQKYSGELKNSGQPIYSWMARFAYGASITLAIYALAGSKPEGGGKCISRTMFTLASAAALGTEIYLYFATQNELNKIKKEYQKKALDTKTYNAQAQAFEYLIAEQEAIEKVSKQRQTFYMITGAAFAAAALIAGIELLPVANATFPRCEGEKPSSKTPPAKPGGAPAAPANPPAAAPAAQPNPNLVFFNQYQKAKDRLYAAARWGTDQVFPTACAADDPMSEKYSYISLLLGAGATVAAMQVKSVKKFLQSSWGILTVAGSASVLSFLLSGEASKQAKEAKENADKVRKILAQFKDDMAIFCPSGQDDLSNAKCYCYNTDGSKNLNHSNSETCKSLWQQQDQNLYATPGDYKNSGQIEITGCMTVNMQYDQTCQCKNLVNPTTKQNACLKSTGIDNAVSTLPSALGLNKVTAGVNDLLNGNLNSANIHNPNLNQQAATYRKNVEKMLTEIPDKPAGLDPFSDQSAKDLVDKTATTQLRRAAGTGALAMSSNPAAQSLANQNPDIKKAAEKSGIQTDVQIINPGGKGGDKKEENEYKFELGGGKDAGNSVTEFQSPGEKPKEYQFQNQDVNSNDASLWQIITNRYIKSGLRRLFGGEEEKKAKPAEQ
jgi:hypothetical protein